MTGRYIDDPLPLIKMFALAVMPATNVGFAMAVHPRSKLPVGGAAAGLPCCVTATTKMNTAMKKVEKPNQVSHPRRENVRTDEKPVMSTADTKLKIIVQAPCSESALKAVEQETIPAAVMSTCATRIWMPTSSLPMRPQRRPHISANAAGQVRGDASRTLERATHCDIRDGGYGSRPR